MTSSSSNPNCPPAVTAALTHCTGWRHWIFSSPCAVPRHGEGISGFLPHFPLNSCVLLEYSPWCFFFFPKLNEEERKFMRRKRIYSYILYFWICSSHKYSTAPQYHILPLLLLLALVSFASLLNNHKLSFLLLLVLKPNQPPLWSGKHSCVALADLPDSTTTSPSNKRSLHGC